jgi:hypothetical protein
VSSLENLQLHLDMLEKVVKFEKKSEFKRFLLILCVGGFVSTVGGFIAFVFNRFLGVDPTFFMFNMTDNPDLAPTNEPALFLAVWLLYLIPIMSIIVFSTGSTGIINWNRSYRIIASMAIILFFLVHITILVLGVSNAEFIPLIWGIAVCIGFVAARWPLSDVTENSNLLNGLAIFGVLALVLGAVAALWLPVRIAQLVYAGGLGIIMSGTGLISYILIGRST